jgi:hypothetical protein
LRNKKRKWKFNRRANNKDKTNRNNEGKEEKNNKERTTVELAPLIEYCWSAKFISESL